METVLRLNRGGLPPFSARGCTQELHLVPHGHFQRTVNGSLVFLGDPLAEQKYKTIIYCQDITVLDTHHLNPGQEVEVECIQSLWQKIKGGEGILDRLPVPGSVQIFHQGLPFENYTRENRLVTLPLNQEVFVTYRPILTMRVLSYMLSRQEWAGKSGWKIELEEV